MAFLVVFSSSLILCINYLFDQKKNKK